MDRLTRSIKEQIYHKFVELQRSGVKFYGIYAKVAKALQKNNVFVDKSIVRYLVRRFQSTGSFERKKGGGRPTVVNWFVKTIIDQIMSEDDEATAVDIQKTLEECGHDISLSTINKTRTQLGWTRKRTRYGHMVRASNVPKRLQWATENLHSSFDDVIWTDETTICLEPYRRQCYRKKTAPARRKPKPKNPVTVHAWAGISRRGATKICVYKESMDAKLYVEIIDTTLLPFLREEFPDGHRFMQDNDPVHTSRRFKAFVEEQGINWWKTPAGTSSKEEILEKLSLKVMNTPAK